MIVPQEVRTILAKISEFMGQGYSNKEAIRLTTEDMARREEALARYAAPAAALSSLPQTAAAIEQRHQKTRAASVRASGRCATFTSC